MFIVGALAGLTIVLSVVAYGNNSTIDVAIPVLGENGRMGAKIVKIHRPSNLFGSVLVKIGGGGNVRDAFYHSQSETKNGQVIVHGASSPKDLHLADCAPVEPMTAAEVFSGVGPANANAWGYRYADKDAVFETTCIKQKINAGQPVEACFREAGAGQFFGVADGFSFVNAEGTLSIPAGDPFALVIASMKVVSPQIARNQRCSKPISPVCGDMFIDKPETCDDGNDVDGDGCSNTCQVPKQCSDTRDNDADDLVDCADPGCHSDGDASNDASCMPSDNTESNALSSCGDGVIDAEETCDDGNTVNFDICKNDCQQNICGDGIPTRIAKVSAPGAACDDGDSTSGDGCNDVCITENRYNCEFKTLLNKDECTIPIGGGV